MRAPFLALALLPAACSSSGDGPRYLAKKGHYSMAPLGDGWAESRDLGSTVFSDGHGHTIAIRAVAKHKGWPKPREADLVVPATERVLRSLPEAEVSGPQRLDLDGFQAVAFDLTFTPARGGGQRYQRRHITLIGRRGVWHLLHTAKEGALADTAAAFERTLDATGSIDDYNFTTAYEHDSKGRLTAVRGPRSVNDDTEYVYWGSGNGLSTDHLKEVKRRTGASSYLVTSHYDYDFWGSGAAKRVTDPNLKSVCRTYDAKYGLVASSRLVINGSDSDCSSSGSADETTTFEYDTHRRLTKTKQPQGNCITNSYDSEGRLATVTLGDNDGSGGCYTTQIDSLEHTYSADGRLTKTEWKDDTGTVTRRQEYTYQADRRLATLVNPVSTSYAKTFLYDADGVPSELRHEDYDSGEGGPKTEWDVDALNRTTALRRFDGEGEHLDFTLTPAAILDFIKSVLDPAEHKNTFVRDDRGLKVKEIIDDDDETQAFTPTINLFVYDEAGNVVTEILSDGSGDEVENGYSYDPQNRRLTEDLDGSCGGEAGAEIQYVYDALPGGVSCPLSGWCANLAGRLAYVKSKLWCDTSKGDDTFDTEYIYSYRGSQRTQVQLEFVKNDGGGSTPTIAYGYTKNGHVSHLTYPDSTELQYLYDRDELGRSDANKLGHLLTQIGGCCQTPVYDIYWYPFGPLKRYTQRTAFQHGSSFYNVIVLFTRNLAYRLTDLLYHTGYTGEGGDDIPLAIDYSEDVRGRYGQREFSSTEGGSTLDMFFLYDDFSRVTCRRTTTGSSCPTSGSDLAENITYNASSDRETVILQNALLAAETYTYKYDAAKPEQIQCLHWDTTPTTSCAQANTRLDFAYDGRGNRILDDDNVSSGSSDDKRSYVYDAKNNLVGIGGKYWVSTSTMHDYTIANAYDHRNRRIFKSFTDDDTGDEAHWFFYYDQLDRMIEAVHTPDITDADTYSVYKWFWVHDRPVLYYQTDIVDATPQSTTRRYLNSDEQGRPLQAWTYTDTTQTELVWEVEPGLFGWDVPTTGEDIFQPLRFPGQCYDLETEAVTMDGSGNKLVKRPGLTDNRYRAYDSFTGTYTETDPILETGWAPYSYSAHDPVSSVDPSGLITRPVGGYAFGVFSCSFWNQPGQSGPYNPDTSSGGPIAEVYQQCTGGYDFSGQPGIGDTDPTTDPPGWGPGGGGGGGGDDDDECLSCSDELLHSIDHLQYNFPFSLGPLESWNMGPQCIETINERETDCYNCADNCGSDADNIRWDCYHSAEAARKECERVMPIIGHK